ncbi:hypothetical protein L1987_80746 [Smallanthus sonchifolius]|uniref:Uncharacterized protein n=1 Tax=Smallanthus sonchifolius TaxID=185202 RepID=A0ACB8YPL9_9ASTR|nr:hypothetical protein L1987_80746 [Smallanthus sonchifolius]
MFHASHHSLHVHASEVEIEAEVDVVKSVADQLCPIRILLDRVVLTSTGVLLGCWQVISGTDPVNTRSKLRNALPYWSYKIQVSWFLRRTIPVHFTDPFHISTRVTDQGSDGSLLLQVILQSQVKTSLTIHDVWLDLQDGFSHAGRGDGRPTSGLFPLVVPPSSKSGILFGISLGTTTTEGGNQRTHSSKHMHFLGLNG